MKLHLPLGLRRALYHTFIALLTGAAGMAGSAVTTASAGALVAAAVASSAQAATTTISADTTQESLTIAAADTVKVSNGVTLTIDDGEGAAPLDLQGTLSVYGTLDAVGLFKLVGPLTASYAVNVKADEGGAYTGSETSCSYTLYNRSYGQYPNELIIGVNADPSAATPEVTIHVESNMEFKGTSKLVINKTGIFDMQGKHLDLVYGGKGSITVDGGQFLNSGSVDFKKGTLTITNGGIMSVARLEQVSSVTISGEDSLLNLTTANWGNNPIDLETKLIMDGGTLTNSPVDMGDYANTILSSGTTISAGTIVNSMGNITIKGGSITGANGAVHLTAAGINSGSYTAGTIDLSALTSVKFANGGSITATTLKTNTGTAAVITGGKVSVDNFSGDLSLVGGTEHRLGTVANNNTDISLSGGAAVAIDKMAANKLTVNDATLTLSAPAAGVASVTVNTLTLSGALQLTVNDLDSLTAGTYTLLSCTTLSDSGSYLTALADTEIESFGPQSYAYVVNGKTLQLQVTSTAADLVWNGGTAEWTGAGVWTGDDDGTFAQWDNVTFEGGTVTISGEVKPGAIVVQGTADTTLTGEGSIVGTGLLTTLTKNGTGTLTIETSNDFAGGTIINEGTVKATTAGALGSGTIEVAGGSLSFNPEGWANSLELGEGASVTLTGTPGAFNATSLTLAAGSTLDMGGYSLANPYINSLPVDTWLKNLNGRLTLSNTHDFSISAGTADVCYNSDKKITLKDNGSGNTAGYIINKGNFTIEDTQIDSLVVGSGDDNVMAYIYAPAQTVEGEPNLTVTNLTINPSGALYLYNLKDAHFETVSGDGVAIFSVRGTGVTVNDMSNFGGILSLGDGSDLTVLGDVAMIGRFSYYENGLFTAKKLIITDNQSGAENHLDVDVLETRGYSTISFASSDKGAINIGEVIVTTPEQYDGEFKLEDNYAGEIGKVTLQKDGDLTLSSCTETHIGSITTVKSADIKLEDSTRTRFDSVHLEDSTTKLTVDDPTDVYLGNITGAGELKVTAGSHTGTGTIVKTAYAGAVEVSKLSLDGDANTYWGRRSIAALVAESVKLNTLYLSDANTMLKVTGKGDALTLTNLTSSVSYAGYLVANNGNIKLGGSTGTFALNLIAGYDYDPITDTYTATEGLGEGMGVVDLTGFTSNVSVGGIVANELKLNTAKTTTSKDGLVQVGAMSGDLKIAGALTADTVHSLGVVTGVDTDISLTYNRSYPAYNEFGAKATATSLGSADAQLNSVTVGKGYNTSAEGSFLTVDDGLYVKTVTVEETATLVANGDVGIGTLKLTGGSFLMAAPAEGVENDVHIGTLNLSKASYIGVSDLASLGVGTHTLLTYDTLSGESYLNLAGAAAGSLRSYELVLDTEGKSIGIKVSVADGTLIWDAEGGTVWSADPEAGSEWILGGIADEEFDNGVAVVFEGGSAEIVGEVAPGSLLVCGTEDTTLSGTGKITGETGLTKSGSGTLELATQGNDYTGATDVQGGTMLVSGSLTGTTATVAEGATLAVSGAATLDSLTVAGAASTTAGSQLAAGELVVNEKATLDAASTVTADTLTVNGALTATADSDITAGDVALGTTGTLETAGKLAATTMTVDGTATLAGAAELSAQTLTVNGAVSTAAGSALTAETLNVNDKATLDVAGTLTVDGTMTVTSNGVVTGQDGSVIKAGTLVMGKTLETTGSVEVGTLTFGTNAVLRHMSSVSIGENGAELSATMTPGVLRLSYSSSSGYTLAENVTSATNELSVTQGTILLTDRTFSNLSVGEAAKVSFNSSTGLTVTGALTGTVGNLKGAVKLGDGGADLSATIGGTAMELTGKNGTYTISDSAASATNTLSITAGSAVLDDKQLATLSVAAGAALSTKGDLAFDGTSASASVAGSLAVNGALDLRNGSSMTVAEGGTVSATGPISIGDASTLTVADGMSLGSGQSMSIAATGKLDGDLTAGAGSSLTIAGGTVTGELTLNGTALTLAPGAQAGSLALGETANTLTVQNIGNLATGTTHTLLSYGSLTGAESAEAALAQLKMTQPSTDVYKYELAISDLDGGALTLTVTKLANVQTWDKTTEDPDTGGIWSTNEDDQHWEVEGQEDSSHHEEDRVTLFEGGTATVEGEVATNSITVTGEDDTTWKVEDEESKISSNTLTKTGTGTLTIETNENEFKQTDIYEGKVVVSDATMLGQSENAAEGEGKVTLHGGELEVTEGSMTVDNSTNASVTTNDGNLDGDTSALTVTTGAENSTLTATTGNVEVQGAVQSGNTIAAAEHNIITQEVAGDSNAMTAAGYITTSDKELSGSGNVLTAGETISTGAVTGTGNELTASGDIKTGTVSGENNVLTSTDGGVNITAGGGSNNTVISEGGAIVIGTVTRAKMMKSRMAKAGGAVDGDIYGDNGLYDNSSTSDHIAVQGSITGDNNTLNAGSYITVGKDITGAGNTLTAATDITVTGQLGGTGNALTAGETITLVSGGVQDATGSLKAANLNVNGNTDLNGTVDIATATAIGAGATLDVADATLTNLNGITMATDSQLKGYNPASVSIDGGDLAYSTADGGMDILKTGDAAYTLSNDTDGNDLTVTAGTVTLKDANVDKLTVTGGTVSMDSSVTELSLNELAEGSTLRDTSGTVTLGDGSKYTVNAGKFNLSADANGYSLTGTGDPSDNRLQVSDGTMTLMDTELAELIVGNSDEIAARVELGYTGSTLSTESLIVNSDAILDLKGNGLNATTSSIIGEVINYGGGSLGGLQIDVHGNPLDVSSGSENYTLTDGNNVADNSLDIIASDKDVKLADSQMENLSVGSGVTVKTDGPLALSGTLTAAADTDIYVAGGESTVGALAFADDTSRVHIGVVGQDTIASATGDITTTTDGTRGGQLVVDGWSQDPLSYADGERLMVAKGITGFDTEAAHELVTRNVNLVEEDGDSYLEVSVNHKGARKNPAQQSISAALTASEGAAGRLGEVQQALAHTGSEAEALAALSSLGGAGIATTMAAQMDASREHMRTLRGAIGQPQMHYTPASGKGGLAQWEQEKNLWAMATGNSGNLGNDGRGGMGYTRHDAGVLAGADVTLNHNTLVGVAAGYSRSHVESCGQTNSADHYFVDAYGRYNHGNWSHSATLGVGVYDWDLKRTVHVATADLYADFNGQGRGQAKGMGLNFSYEVAYNIELRENHTLAPVFQIESSYNHLSGYREYGTLGNAGLDVDFKDTVTATLGLGARYAYAFEGFGNSARKGHVAGRVMAILDAADNNAEMTGRFIGSGAGFSTESTKHSRMGLLIGADALVPVSKDWSVFGNASFEIREDFRDVSAGVGVKYTF